MPAPAPLSTLLSRILVACTIELDNEFERRFEQSGGGARIVSLVMWSNFMRFVGEGITVGELPTAVGLQKPRVLSTLGGMERWRYVFVSPAAVRHAPGTKRDGFGSARGLDSTWVVRLTPAGRVAEAIWPQLFDEIEGRWDERFGTAEIDELRGSLRAIVGAIDVELPEYLPIVGGVNGMTADLPPPPSRHTGAREGDLVSSLPLSALLSQALLAYTSDFEAESPLSLPLSANVVRVLDEKGVLVKDLPLLAGVSKEATAMALTFLAKTGWVVVDGASAGTRSARLSPTGRDVQRDYDWLHAEVAEQWETRFGAEAVGRLRSSLQHLLEQRDGKNARLARGLEPYDGGWRGSAAYRAQTEAVLDDPIARLPHYPMVLHRGGWPDGS